MDEIPGATSPSEPIEQLQIVRSVPLSLAAAGALLLFSPLIVLLVAGSVMFIVDGPVLNNPWALIEAVLFSGLLVLPTIQILRMLLLRPRVWLEHDHLVIRDRVFFRAEERIPRAAIAGARMLSWWHGDRNLADRATLELSTFREPLNLEIRLRGQIGFESTRSIWCGNWIWLLRWNTRPYFPKRRRHYEQIWLRVRDPDLKYEAIMDWRVPATDVDGSPETAGRSGPIEQLHVVRSAPWSLAMTVPLAVCSLPWVWAFLVGGGEPLYEQAELIVPIAIGGLLIPLMIRIVRVVLERPRAWLERDRLVIQDPAFLRAEERIPRAEIAGARMLDDQNGDQSLIDKPPLRLSPFREPFNLEIRLRGEVGFESVRNGDPTWYERLTLHLLRPRPGPHFERIWLRVRDPDLKSEAIVEWCE
ncbi:hypothetical protein [Actinomadura sp. HBU206391]|uniref:hypothetical protein n=1 Tax=Actinomadura sp. HBU206391 TaxID=2731692 RepID=UPI00165097FC|nr:hypothetical protein [Actinomadura sp. HBU206391]MBC6460737.1 hypothetical protein [Actinomadura sp. HBU206391]